MRLDVAISGAGPVGATLAIALAAAGRKVALIEPASAGGRAFRPIALSHASRLLLERLGAWQGLQATPIDSIHVSQAGRLGRTVLAAAEAGLPALGHVVDYGLLAQSLARHAAGVRVDARIVAVTPDADALQVELSSGERLQAACLAHAEGAAEGMREKRYAQDALVADVEVSPASRDRAWERFTAEGPLALLPHQGRYAVVWGMHTQRAEALAAAGDEAFLAALQLAFGRRAGRFARVHERARVPLSLRRRLRRVDGRQVYVGNAAQALHPVAGQGLNLGLRDAWELARTVSAHADAGDPRVLARYAALRKLDVGATTAVTDLLATLFTGDNELSGALRGAAMLALDACAPARRFFARRMVFGPSAMP